jgi:phage protein D
MTTPIYEGQNFYAPHFEIKLRGQNIDREVIRDVLEVSYRDSLDKLDSFEFTLHDWNPVERLPKYSSPYDESGQLRKLNNDTDVPNFDPGAQVELYMGYYGAEEPRLMMTGQIVSLSPSFPGGGPPTLRVRALSLLYTLQTAQVVRLYEEETDSSIARQIADELGVTIEIPNGQESEEEEHEYIMIRNQPPIIFLMERAKRLGYDIYVKINEDSEEPVLFFGRTPTSQTTYELTWGKSLVQFTPTLKVKGQVAKVVVRGWNPAAQGNDRVITGEATWQDLDQDLPDQQLLSSIDSALAETQQVELDHPISSQGEAEREALGILEERVKDLITGSGSTVGLPDLRAGRTVVINGLGPRYSGRYVLTETTHKMGGSGYTTDFSARMVGAA